MNATQVFEKSVSSTENNPPQEYIHPDDQTARSDRLKHKFETKAFLVDNDEK